MGVAQVDFWQIVQTVIAHPEWMSNFPAIVDALRLQLKLPLDTVDPLADEPQSRSDLSNRSNDVQFIERGTYGTFDAQPPDQALYRRLILELRASAVCLTPHEVERIYGPTRHELVFATHSPQSEAVWANPLGYAYSLGYRPSASFLVTFSVMPSGCINRISIAQRFETK